MKQLLATSASNSDEVSTSKPSALLLARAERLRESTTTRRERWSVVFTARGAQLTEQHDEVKFFSDLYPCRYFTFHVSGFH